MKKILVLVLALLMMTAACAETIQSDLGYSIEADPAVWSWINPELLPELEARGFAAGLAASGMDDAYFENFDSRSFEMYADLSGVYGNVVVRLISAENSEGDTLDDYLVECREVVIPYYVSQGLGVALFPEKIVIGEREWVRLGLDAMGRELYQYMTINEHTGRWYNFTFTRVPEETLLTIVESLQFTAPVGN